MLADALSRKNEDVEALFCALSIIQPDWIIESREEWNTDPSIWKLVQQLQKDPSVSNTFVWNNYSLQYKIHLYICKKSQLKQTVLLKLHISTIGGHSIFLKSYHRIKKDFFWEDLKSDVWKFVAKCLVCNITSWRQLRPWVFYNHYPHQVNVGRRSQWI